LVLLFGCAAISAHAAFSSIYIFGDSVSTTTTNQYADLQPTEYYGKRYCNGRNWVEVLAQRQGLGANSTSNSIWAYSSNNLSFYGHYSPLLVTNVSKFTAPANASNCLFVVWVCNADFVGDVSDANVGAPNAPNNGTNLLIWTTNINLHLTNHFKAITNLYAKGMRTLIAPNAVNIMLAPQFNPNPDNSYKAFVRQRVVSFNTSYATMMQQIQATSPGLKIYVPDMFGIFDAAVTNAAAYGLTNALYSGQPIDVIEASSPVVGLLPNANTNGPGTNYVFWDPVSPSARTHELFADVAQQALSPVNLSGMAQVNTSNRLDMVNVPVGLNGTVLYATNLTQTPWLTNSTFSSLTLTQGVFVSPTNSQRFYQVKFPYAWTWP
jgi:phospholipase/lecithinase/hemolysin